MKIIIVIPTLKQGGAERVVSVLANQWSKLGHSVHLALLAQHKPFYEVSNKIKVHHFGFTNKNIIQKPLAELHTMLKLRREIKAIKPDFVISFMEKYNILTILSTRLLKVDVFVSDRSNPLEKRSLFIGLSRKLLYRLANGVIAQTILAKKLAEAQTNNKNIMVLPNPVKDINLPRKIIKKNTILNIGRLVPEKGQKYLIESFARLEHHDWSLTILGDGPLRNELKSQIDFLGLNGRVHMPGAVPNIDTHLSEASIYAFTSISEGFPNALCEAMAAGLPCVSFDCDAGPRDLIENRQNGILVPVCDIESLTRELKELIEDKDKRDQLGHSAKLIARRLRSDVIAIDWLNSMTN